ncbi:MAG: T9SS type A sorting domain-containing protein [Calditrichaeota bacterium]|nr:T9SS type A sorting domain-containing protein [Calditrichota bacterium]
MNKTILLVTFICIALTLNSDIFAQDSSGITMLGSHFSNWDQVYDVVVQEGNAYVTTGGSGLRIVDVTDINNPREVGYTNAQRFSYSLCVEGDFAYVIGSGDLMIFNVSDPEHPIEIGSFNPPGSSESIFISGGYAYLTMRWSGQRDGGLYIIDVSDPEDPVEVGFFTDDLMDIWDIAVEGDYAYLIDPSEGLYIVDVSNPEQPHQTGFLAMDQEMGKVVVAGNYAYAMEYWHGCLRIVNISNPNRPSEAGRYDFDHYVGYSLYVDEDYLYLADCELVVLDISNPVRPTGIGLFELQGESRGIFVTDDVAYIANTARGLQFVEISNPRQPEDAGFFNKDGYITDVALSNDFAFLASGKEGLWVIDVSRPDSLEAVGHLDAPREVHKLCLHGNYAYLADYYNCLQIADISNPGNPVVIAVIETEDMVMDVSVTDSLLLIANWEEGLIIYDITDVEHPEEIGRFDGYEVLAVAVSETLAYIVEYRGRLRIVDISDPRHLEEVSTFSSGEHRTAAGIAVSGDYACILWNNDWEMYGGFTLIDVSDPENPEVLSYYSFDGFVSNAVIIDDNIIIAGPGLRIINVSDPAQPIERGFYQTYCGASGVAVDRDLAYVAQGLNFGVYDCSEVLRVQPKQQLTPTEFTLFPAYPNPFNSTTTIKYNLPLPSHVSLAVYNLTGQQITKLFEGHKQQGIHTTTLTANDLPSGLYFVRLKAPDQVFTRKVMLIR